MRRTTALLAAAVTVGATGFVAAPAGADLVTRCVGEGGAVTVAGDLVVPRGESCSLVGTTVRGDVRLAPGADLVAEGVTVDGGVRVTENAFANFYAGSTVAGTVASASGYGVYAQDSSLAAYVGRVAGESSVESFFYAVDSEISGRVDNRVGEMLLEGSTVAGNVRAVGGSYTDVVDSTLLRTLTVVDNELGGAVCESEVDGDAAYSGNAFGLQLGGGGGLYECDGSSYWGGDVDISDNTGDVVVSNNIVRGDLSGTGNDPAPTGSGNRVRGEVSGQFVDLQPTPDAGALQLAPGAKGTERMLSLQGQAAQADRAAGVATEAAARRAEALAAADAAGAAF